jgi:hypothetical protein
MGGVATYAGSPAGCPVYGISLLEKRGSFYIFKLSGKFISVISGNFKSVMTV